MALAFSRLKPVGAIQGFFGRRSALRSRATHAQRRMDPFFGAGRYGYLSRRWCSKGTSAHQGTNIDQIPCSSCFAI